MPPPRFGPPAGQASAHGDDAAFPRSIQVEPHADAAAAAAEQLANVAGQRFVEIEPDFVHLAVEKTETVPRAQHEHFDQWDPILSKPAGPLILARRRRLLW